MSDTPTENYRIRQYFYEVNMSNYSCYYAPWLFDARKIRTATLDAERKVAGGGLEPPTSRL